MDTGRPTKLDDELRLKIRDRLSELDSRPTMARISEITEVEYSTIKGWVFRNYQGFAEFLDGLKRDWKLRKAQENIEEFLTMDTLNTAVTKKGDTFEYTDAKILRIKADTTFFVAETLGKETYSKRSEITGKNGGPIEHKITDQEFETILGEYGTRKKESGTEETV